MLVRPSLNFLNIFLKYKHFFLDNFFLGGLYFLPIYLVTILVGGLWETIFAVVRRHEINEGFLVTGMLIPLVMPPTIPLWMLGVATAFGTLVSAAVMLAIVGTYNLSAITILVVISISGALQGLLLPSRDLLIRSVTPLGSMGKVMGFLTMGMMLAAAVVQPVFGWLMDMNEPRWVFWLSAIFVAGGLFCFSSARRSGKQINS